MAERFGDPPSDAEWIRTLTGRLAECYRLSGADPDGDSDSMLAEHAVQAVRGLREDYDAAPTPEELAATRQRLAQLLEAVKELREAEDPRVHYGALKRTCQVAREIEKERKS